MKQLTLAFLLRNDQICLAQKKRGFGIHKWNGYGGKLKPDETPETAVIREIAEESGVRVAVESLEPVAVHEFVFPNETHEVHVFLVREWHGEPVETDEMRPAWYTVDAIPYTEMWADDVHWLPRVLAGERLRGQIQFAADGESIEHMEWWPWQ